MWFLTDTTFSMDTFTPTLIWETGSLQGTLTHFMWLSYHDITALYDNIAISYL